MERIEEDGIKGPFEYIVCNSKLFLHANTDRATESSKGWLEAVECVVYAKSWGNTFELDGAI